MTPAEVRPMAAAGGWPAPPFIRRIASETLFRSLFCAVSVCWLIAAVLIPPAARNWLLWLWASAAAGGTVDSTSSVPETAYADEAPNELELIGRGDHAAIAR